MYRILIVLLVVLQPGAAAAFFFGLGGVGPTSDPGIESDTQLFVNESRLRFADDGAIIARIDADGYEYFAVAPALREGDQPRFGVFQLRENDHVYHTEALVGEDDAALSSYLTYQPVQGRKFTIHRQDGYEGRYLVQVAPRKEGGKWLYHPIKLIALADTDDVGRMAYFSDMLDREAKETAKTLRSKGFGVVSIGMRFQVDNRRALQAVIAEFEKKEQPQSFSVSQHRDFFPNRATFEYAKTAAGNKDLILRGWEQLCRVEAIHPLDPTRRKHEQGVSQIFVEIDRAAHACARATALGSKDLSVMMGVARTAMFQFARDGKSGQMDRFNRTIDELEQQDFPLAAPIRAMVHLGMPPHVPRDLDRAVLMLKEQAGSGNYIASYVLGSFYADGYLQKVLDRQRAMAHLQTAAKAGVAQAYYYIGKMHRGKEGDGEVAALEAYRQGMSAGDPMARLAAGEAYLFGLGVEKDQEKAFSYFRTAAHRGVPRAIYHEGFMRLFGRGTNKSASQARRLLEDAVRLGVVAAKSELGGMLVLGLGGKKDVERGNALLKEAKDADVSSAEYWYTRIARESTSEQER